MEITSKITIRDKIFENFRTFIKDENQVGDTLSSVSPVKFQGTRTLISRRAYLMRLAYKPETPVAAISLLFPPEICWAAGFVPFNWEMFASLLASHSKVIDMTNKGAAPVPRCSFINSLKGASLSGILPPPNIILSSSAFCEGVGFMFSELKDFFGRQHLHLDIPAYLNDSTLTDAANHLKMIYHSLCDMNLISPDKRMENLRKAMYFSMLARKEYNELAEIRKKYAPLDLGLEPLQWHTVFLAMFGDESGYRICRQLREDVEKYALTQPKSDGIPVSTFGLIPYGRTEIWTKLKEAGAYVTFEGVNYMGDSKLLNPDAIEFETEETLFKTLVYNLMHAAMHGLELKNNSNHFIDLAKESGAKGMITFVHEHCQMLAVRLDEVERAAEEKGLKSVSISGDCILGMPPGPSGIRLGTFLNSLGNKARQKKEQSVIAGINPKEGYRVGIDFGSGFSKFVQIDNKNQVVKNEIFNSGIDYPYLLREIRKKINTDQDVRFGIAGVGGDNPLFKDTVHLQTTEISALIQAVHLLFPDEAEFMVVDIGTQDVKVLKFYKDEDEPWVNTNKSCGAGTGMVLKQILERWQQTNPEIKFSDLDEMASEATATELVNTTCGIFAVTNVVSALVKSDIHHRKQILKGVYKYIAEQAIKLMPAHERHQGRVLLTGGIANHFTLRAIFADQGFELVELPSFIHPQFLVAYGTAVSIQ